MNLLNPESTGARKRIRVRAAIALIATLIPGVAARAG